MSDFSPIVRRHARQVWIDHVPVGSDAPVVVQSMTNTDTADIVATTAQIVTLAQAGSELVRITVNTAEAAAAVPQIRQRLDDLGCNVPLVGDFHFNGERLLRDSPPAPKPWPSTASILATWAKGSRAMRNSPI